MIIYVLANFEDFGEIMFILFNQTNFIKLIKKMKDGQFGWGGHLLNCNGGEHKVI